MAYSPSEKYPGAVDVDPDYQGGKFRDNNPSTTNNGSPLKAIDRNELLARDEAIMNDAGFEYSGVADTPQDSQLFKAYKASLGNGANLLSNHNFLIQTPDDSQPLPSATPTSYPPGYQIFSGVFANETTGITNLTYIDGRVSFSGGDLYFAVPNTGGIERLTSDQLAASVADFDGKPRTRGVSFALVGDEYRVTVGIDALEDASAVLTPLGSVKFEQGSMATGHDVQAVSARNLSDYTDIVYKASGGNSAVENMVDGIPVNSNIGGICSTINTAWIRKSSGSSIADFFTSAPKLNVDDFYTGGILPGENENEDTQAWIRCFNACQLIGRGMEASSPLYTLNSPIGEITYGGFYFEGSGSTSTVIKNKILTGAPSSNYVFTINSPYVDANFKGFTLDGDFNALAGGWLKTVSGGTTQIQKIMHLDCFMKNHQGSNIPLFDCDGGLGWHWEDFYADRNDYLGTFTDVQNFTYKRIACTDNTTGLLFNNMQYFDGDNLVYHRNGAMTFTVGESINIGTGKCKATSIHNAQFSFNQIRTVNFNGTMLFGDSDYYARFRNCSVINLNGIEIFPVTTSNLMRGFQFNNDSGFAGSVISVDGINYRMQNDADFLSLFRFEGPNKVSRFSLSGYIGNPSLSGSVAVAKVIDGADMIEHLNIDGLTVQAQSDMVIASLGDTELCWSVSERGYVVTGSNAANQPDRFNRPGFSNSFYSGVKGLGLRGGVSSVYLEDIKGGQQSVDGFTIPANSTVVRSVVMRGGLLPSDSFVKAQIDVTTDQSVTLSESCYSSNRVSVGYHNHSASPVSIPSHNIRVIVLYSSNTFVS